MNLAEVSGIIIASAAGIIVGTSSLVAYLIKTMVVWRFEAMERANIERAVNQERSFKRLDGHITDHSGEIRLINDKLQMIDRRVTKIESRCALTDCRTEGD